MRLYVLSLLLALTSGSPLLEDRGSCPKTNLVASALHASTSASSWCSKYLSIGTETKTVTATPKCSTLVVKTTHSDGTKTVTTSASIAYVTATVTATSVETDTSTITNTVTSVTTETSTSTSTGTLTITSACDPNDPRVLTKRFKRAVTTPAALKGYGASCLSSACSCLSLACAKTTVTKTAKASTVKITSTIEAVISTTVTVSPTSTITQTSTLSSTTATSVSIDSTLTLTETATSTVAEATVSVESFSIQLSSPGTTVDGQLAGLNINGTLVAAYSTLPVEDFVWDPTTGYIMAPQSGLVLSMNSGSSFSVITASNPNDPYVSPIQCSDSCGDALSCTVGTAPLSSNVYFYLDGGFTYVYASVYSTLQGSSPVDLAIVAPI